jgi:hypothetical protein
MRREIGRAVSSRLQHAELRRHGRRGCDGSAGAYSAAKGGLITLRTGCGPPRRAASCVLGSVAETPNVRTVRLLADLTLPEQTDRVVVDAVPRRETLSDAELEAMARVPLPRLRPGHGAVRTTL